MLRSLAPLAVAAAVAACGGQSTDPTGLAGGDEEVLFLTQQVRPDIVMDALFEGRVVLDDAGCLRLDGPDPATVVWPLGFRLDRSGSALTVRGAEGGAVGVVGGGFRLGGGEVPMLHEGIAVSAGDRAAAAQRCPGRYWIVGDVLD